MVAKGFSTETERCVAIHSVVSRSFWKRLGRFVPPSDLCNPIAKLVLQIAREVAQDHDIPSPLLVEQRAFAWNNEGKVGDDDIAALVDLLATKPLIGPDTVIAEVVPVLRQSMGIELGKDALKRAMNGGAFGDISDRMRQCDKLGEAVAELDSRSSELGADTDSILSDVNRNAVLASGVLEVDALLGGGYLNGTLTTFMLDTGMGKSFACTHQAAASVLQQFNVGYISTELSKGEIHSRILAAVTGAEINAIKRDPAVRKQAIAAYERLRRDYGIGRVIVEKVDADAVTPRDIQAWIEAQERQHGLRIDVLIVDYGDELISEDSKANGNGYDRGRDVWNGLAVIAHSDTEPRWVFTASQSKRPEFKAGEMIPKLTLNSVADSYGKPRKVDYWWSLTPQPDKAASAGYIWSLDKHRTDDSGVVGQAIGPIPHQRSRGRLGDMTHLHMG